MSNERGNDEPSAKRRTSGDKKSDLDGRYRIRAPLRCEGVGRLDCAEELGSGDRLAIRWLPMDANGLTAAHALVDLPKHRSLPGIRGTGHVGTSAYVAMDFPEGVLLSARGSPLSETAVVEMGTAVAEALAAVHAQNMSHGEISSDSVLLLPLGRAMLWDVPLVIANRLTDRRSEHRLLTQLPRVAPHLAPERARGLSATASADIWSLASVLCQALGGQPPTAKNTLQCVFLVASGAAVPRPPADCSPGLRDILTSMLNPDAASRPSAVEVARRLTALSHSDRVTEVPVTQFSAPRRPRRSRRIATVAAACLAVTVGASAVGFFALRGERPANAQVHIQDPTLSAPEHAVLDVPVTALDAIPAAAPAAEEVVETAVVEDDLLVPLRAKPRLRSGRRRAAVRMVQPPAPAEISSAPSSPPAESIEPNAAE